MIFLRVLPKNFLRPHYSGAPGARGPRFIEPPEPPVPTPLFECINNANVGDEQADASVIVYPSWMRDTGT